MFKLQQLGNDELGWAGTEDKRCRLHRIHLGGNPDAVGGIAISLH
jgi:hypothetical protein